MTQSLVVHHPQVDVGCELFASDTRVHRFVAVVVVPSCEKLLAEVVNGRVLLCEPMLTHQFMSITDEIHHRT